MTKSLIGKIDGPAGPKVEQIPEKLMKRATPPPPSRPVRRPVERRGPIVAGGIIRFDLGRTRSDG
jgi:hypothetical protein